MRLDPVELRGVGIQVTKLEGTERKEPEREIGQGTLQFGAKPPEKPPASAEKVDDEDDVVLIEEPPGKRKATPEPIIISSSPPSPPPQPARTKRKRSATPPSIQAGPSRQPGPSSGAIDPDYLAALPPEFQRMAKEQHAILRARSVSETPTIPHPVTKEPAVAISPAKPKGRHAAAHITKQLRPMVKTSLKTNTIAELPLYSAWSRAERPDGDILGVDMEEDVKVGKYLMSELRDYGIDPDYFSALPEEEQEYVVEEERRKNKHRKILHKPADHSRIRARDRHRAESRMSSMSPSKGSRAGSLPPINRITIPKRIKPSLFNKSELPDVIDIVTKWIDSRGNAGPAAKDAGKVKTYLKKCMGVEAGLTGVETVVEVMKVMRGLLREKWTEREVQKEADGHAGKEWWDTWNGFKRELDEISVKRFGAELRL